MYMRVVLVDFSCWFKISCCVGSISSLITNDYDCFNLQKLTLSSVLVIRNLFSDANDLIPARKCKEIRLNYIYLEISMKI